jgi:fermentation-respiration switch protein FrsA (DUF1100 family)
MDQILVLYNIKGDDNDSQQPNAIVVSVPSGKELLLVDILAVLSPTIGCKFNFYAKCTSQNANVTTPGAFTFLKSPTSVVPVLEDGYAYLLLESSGAPPIVPLGQLAGFADSSRRLVIVLSLCRNNNALGASNLLDEHPPI